MELPPIAGAPMCDMHVHTPPGCSVAVNTAGHSDAATASSPPSLSLLQLPADLLSLAHTHLSARDLLCALAPASRSYAELVLDDSQLWQGQCQRRFDVPPPEQTDEGDDEQRQADDEQPEAWFATNSANSAVAAAAASGSSSAAAVASTSRPNRWLRLYRSFFLTPPRPLQLQVLHADDDGYVPPAGAFPNVSLAQLRDIYSVHNILRPSGKAYCSGRKRNVHVVLALARTARQRARDAAREAGKGDSVNSDATATFASAASASSIAAAAASLPLDSAASPCPPQSPQPLPLPDSFVMTDLKVIAPARGYTSPLSSGFVFFCDTLPTPAQIAAWDDWSEAQWNEREKRRREKAAAGGASGAPATKDAAEEEGEEEEVAPGEGEAEDNESEAKEAEHEERHVESWYDDGPVRYRSRSAARAAPPVPDSFPLRFTGAAGETSNAGAASSPLPLCPDEGAAPARPATLAPLVGFFHLERSGLLSIDPVLPRSGASGSSSSTAAASSFTSLGPLPLPAALQQVPFSYRHRFSRPVHGRFIVLTFLRASQEKTNIDVSYFGVKGYRRGMRAVEPAVPVASATAASSTPTSPEPAAEEAGGSPSAAAAAAADALAPSSLSSLDVSGSASPDSAFSPPTLPPAPAPSLCAQGSASVSVGDVDPDALDDAFDFDAPLTSAHGGGVDLPRLREYLRSVASVSTHMQADVSALDQQLARVQAVMQQQQAAQQQQHALRLRMLLLQTQQLQLQLTTQQLQTQATLQHAARLNANAAAFLQQRREQTAAVEAERALHRARLQLLTEEKEREERLLVSLRARVAEAKEREERLQETVSAHRAAVAAAAARRAEADSADSSASSSSSFSSASFGAPQAAAASSSSSDSGDGGGISLTPPATSGGFGFDDGAGSYRYPSYSALNAAGAHSSSPGLGGRTAMRDLDAADSDAAAMRTAPPSFASLPSSGLGAYDAGGAASRSRYSVPLSTFRPPMAQAQAQWTPQSQPQPLQPTAGSTFASRSFGGDSRMNLASSPFVASASPLSAYSAPSLSSLLQPSTAPGPAFPAAAAPVAPLPVRRDFAFSARTQELLDSLRASRLQREAEHDRRVAEAQSFPRPDNQSPNPEQRDAHARSR